MATSRDTGYRVEGVREVVKALTDLGFEVADLKDVFSEIADRGADAVAAATPRASGALAADVRGNRAKSKAVVTAGRSSIPYAGVINYGWPARGIEPSEFMQRGEAVIEPDALRLLEDGINDKIKDKRFQ